MEPRTAVHRTYAFTLGSGPFRRAVTVPGERVRAALSAAQPVPEPAPEPTPAPGVTSVTLHYDPDFESEAGRVGRVRRPNEEAAVSARYLSKDRWRGMSLVDQVQYLRKIRGEVAQELGKHPALVTNDQILKAAGLRSRDVPRGFWWTLAGDFATKMAPGSKL